MREVLSRGFSPERYCISRFCPRIVYRCSQTGLLTINRTGTRQ